MDSDTYADIVKRLQQVNAVITKLDPAIRSEAFSLLAGYIGGTRAGATGSTQAAVPGDESDTQAELDMGPSESFFTTHDGGKPAENAYLVTAYLYSQYGSSPFSMDDVRAVADHAGLTLPERVDVTLGGAKKGGKPLFKRAGRGKLQPNVHGETYLKNTYEISKGTKRR